LRLAAYRKYSCFFSKKKIDKVNGFSRLSGLGLFQKKIYCFFLFIIFIFFSGFAFPEKPIGYVNDFAGILNQNQISELSSILADFENKTSNQLYVAVFTSLDGDNLESVTIKLGDKWKAGQKEKNNGIILAVFLKEKKIRIEAGYGLEGALTDSIASQIIRRRMAPEFQNNNYFLGIKNGIQSIIEVTKGEYKSIKKKRELSVFDSLILIFGIIVFLYIIIKNPGLFAAAAFMSYGSSGRRGSGFGGYSGGGGFSGGGFSGGGGSFGGGGASGGW